MSYDGGVRCSGYVIVTSSELPSPRHGDVTQHGDDADVDDEGRLVQLSGGGGEFYVIRYATQREPVHGFLGRHLRRRLIALQSHLNATTTTTTTTTNTTTAAAGWSVSELSRVVDWLPRVWLKVNAFLHVVSPPPQLDVTIGNATRSLARLCVEMKANTRV